MGCNFVSIVSLPQHSLLLLIRIAHDWSTLSQVQHFTFTSTSIYFRNGDVRLDSINVDQAPDLGNGVTLYFQFAMTMALTLAVMSLLSLSSLIMIYPEEGMAPQDQDALCSFITIG